MKNFFKDVVYDKTIKLAFFINIFLIAAAAICILLAYGKLPPFIPIFNQLPWGEQRLGTTISIFIPVLAAILILITNSIISAITYKNIPLISRMLAAISLLAGLLTLLFILRTITLFF